MKTLTVIFAAFILAFTFNAFADERFETATGLCHFAYDANDDDNEIYFANCENTIDTHDAGDGQGRLAYGSSIFKKNYDAGDKALKHADRVMLKGADADNTVYPDKRYGSAPNIPCIMVTSNYDAGNDDDNRTVYVTNDWNLEIKAKRKHGDDDDKKYKKRNSKVTYHLSCRGGVKQ